MAVHSFGSVVDASAVVEQVPPQGPTDPIATTAPKRPRRGTVGKVRDHLTVADLPTFTLADNGYWAYTTTDIPLIRVSFDNWVSYTVFRSVESMNAAATLSADLTTVGAKADSAVTTANAALTVANSIPGSTWLTLPGKPSTFPSSPHTHTRAQLSDVGVVGQTLLGAADQQAARAAIGAGTGNGTSTLALGLTATTAAAGNHGHAGSAVSFAPAGTITATNVQAAIEQAALQGGGGTSSEYKPVRYIGGAYEALPATPDPAWRVVEYRGPTAPVPPATAAWAGIEFDWLVRGA